MNSADESFIEVASSQLSEYRQKISGDVFLKARHDGRTIMVLSDGDGSGIKANVIASVIATMALNYAKTQRSMLKSARAVIETFARGHRSRDHMQATFTVVDISDSGEVRIMEFANPSRVIMRDGKICNIPSRREIIRLDTKDIVHLYITEFNMVFGDRIVLFSDGVVNSGFATHRMPSGWGERGIKDKLEQTVAIDNEISAADLCRVVVQTSEVNDMFKVKNDITCASVYFRRPRKILVSTGPPFKESSDKEMVSTILSYDGAKIVCGGTTAQIVSRESGRDVSVIMKRDPSGLPPESVIEGIDMVTEGVLTLGKVKLMLQMLKDDTVKGKGIDSRFVKLLLSHDVIEFLVGSRINSVHHDPTMPMELELRRTVIRDIAKLLEHKYMKTVKIRFI